MSTTKGRKFPVEILTRHEIDKLIKQCSKRAPTGIRNRALIIVLWRSGLRISEALALQIKDIDVDNGTIRVLHGKGDKSRTAGMDDMTGAAIEKWIAARKVNKIPKRAPLFCTLDGKPVQPAYIRNLMTRLGEKAGITKRVHAHGLRHAHASELRMEGHDIGIISKQLGHSSIATTSRYLDHVCPKTVVETIRARK